MTDEQQKLIWRHSWIELMGRCSWSAGKTFRFDHLGLQGMHPIMDRVDSTTPTAALMRLVLKWSLWIVVDLANLGHPAWWSMHQGYPMLLSDIPCNTEEAKLASGAYCQSLRNDEKRMGTICLSVAHHIFIRTHVLFAHGHLRTEQAWTGPLLQRGSDNNC